MVVISAAIRPKRSETAGSRPQLGDILVGELATNLADKKIYTKTSAGDIILVGDGGGVHTGGDGPEIAGFPDGENDGETYIQIGSGSLATLYADGNSDWVVSGDGYWFENTTYKLITQAEDDTRVVYDGALDQYSWTNLLVEFTSDVSTNEGDVFAFGVFDATTSTTTSGGGTNSQASMAGAEHVVRFDFLSGDDIVITNDEFATLVTSQSTTVEGTHNWRLLYTGSNLSDLRLKIYRDNVLIINTTGVSVPNSSRPAFGASSGTNGNSLEIRDFQLSYYDSANSTSAVTAVSRFWFWDDPAQTWRYLPTATKINLADDVLQSIAPTDRQVLAWDTQRAKWVPTDIRENALSRTFQIVSGTVQINESRHFSSLMFTGANPIAQFLDGIEGVQVEILNRGADGLSLTAATGVDLTTGGGLTYVREGGAAIAVYTNGKWTATGDLYDISGAGVVFNIETAQDYEVPASKADGDVIQYDSFLSKFTTGPLDINPIKTSLQSNFALNDLSNVELTGVNNNEFLQYDQSIGKWVNTELPIAQIVAQVGSGLSLNSLGDVAVSGPSEGELLQYNAQLQVWENVEGGNIAAKSDKLATFRPVASNYTLLDSDSTKVIQVAGEATVTLPTNVSVGFQVLVVQNGTGEVTFTASTLYSSGSRFSLREQYSVATCIHLGSGQWYLFGDLKATGTAQGAVIEYVGDLGDVFTDNSAVGDVLVYNGSSWLPDQPFVSLTTLKQIAASSADFAAFKAAIAAL